MAFVLIILGFFEILPFCLLYAFMVLIPMPTNGVQVSMYID